MVNSKIHTFRTERDTGIHRLNTSTIVNVDNDSGMGDTLWQVDNLVGVTRYTTVQEAITNGNLVPISGSGGSALCVSDEGTVVNNDVCCINFVGADVLANQDPTNPCQVNVYIPTPAYPSHYSTVDGNTNGTVPDVPTSQRMIALPSGPRGTNPGEYNENSWAIRLTSRSVTRDSTLNYNNSADILLEDELSTLTAELFDADGTTLIATHTVTPINGNSSSSAQGITINVTNYGTSSDKFKARFAVLFDLGIIIPHSGRCTLKITHSTGGVNYIKAQELFFDSQPNTAVLTGVNIQENNATRIIKYLSGIKYYNLGSPFIIDIADIDYLNGDSYPQNQVHITGTNMGLPAIDLGDGPMGHDLTSWTNDWDDIDDTYHNDNWQITANNFCFVGDGVANANTIDWSNGPLVPSNNYPVLINTWTSQSDELSEYFLDEDYRLMQDFSTSWDSTQSLITYDTGDNSVQTICGRIKVPGSLSATNANNPDFSTRNPGPNPDYTGLTGKRYYRKFTDVTNSVRGSFTMDIQGFTLNDLETNKIEIWIQIPGRMNTPCPVHSSSTFNFGTFDADLSTGSNGPHPTGGSALHYDDAMRVSSSTSNSINVSFGTYGLDATHNSFNMELIINDDSIEPSEIIISW